MKIIKTKSGLFDFKGVILKENDKALEQGTILSNILASYDVNPTRCWQLGKQFATENTVELLAEDVVFVKAAITKASTGDRKWLNVIIAGQLLEMLDSSDKEVEK